MTLNPVCESVETAQGVPLTVTGVAQVKIMKNADLLQTASKQKHCITNTRRSPSCYLRYIDRRRGIQRPRS